MSLLGQDAVGHWALGHPPDTGGTAFTLAISAASYTITGFPVTFTIQEAPAQASYSISGQAASFTIKEAITAGAYGITGKPVSFAVAENAAPGAYAITSFPINEIVFNVESPAQITITGLDTPLHRTGDNYEFKLGGVGHYRLELERAKQLAAITKRDIPPAIDLRTAPKFQPLGSPYSAPQAPAPDAAAVEAQRAAAQMQAAQAAKKQQRDLEAILLLAA